MKLKLFTIILCLLCVFANADQVTTNYKLIIPDEGDMDVFTILSNDIISIDSVMGIISSDTVYKSNVINVNSASDIQLAINTLTADGGGTVHLATGDYRPGVPIIIDTTTSLVVEGEGYGTTITATANDQDVFLIRGSSTDEWMIKDLRIDGNKGWTNRTNGIHITSNTASDVNAVIRDVYIYQATNGISMDNIDCREIILDGVTTYESEKVGFSMEGSDHKLTNCISGNNEQHGFLINDWNSQYTNCKSFGNGSASDGSTNYYGIKVQQGNSQWTNLQVQENYTHGIYIENSKSFKADNLLSQNNHLRGDSETAGDYADIFIADGSKKVYISNAILSTDTANCEYGVYIEDGATDITLMGVYPDGHSISGVLWENRGSSVGTIELRGKVSIDSALIISAETSTTGLAEANQVGRIQILSTDGVTKCYIPVYVGG